MNTQLPETEQLYKDRFEQTPDLAHIQATWIDMSQVQTESISMNLLEPPAVVGYYLLGKKQFPLGTHYTFVTHYKPRWLTRLLMAWCFELYWYPTLKRAAGAIISSATYDTEKPNDSVFV